MGFNRFEGVVVVGGEEMTRLELCTASSGVDYTERRKTEREKFVKTSSGPQHREREKFCVRKFNNINFYYWPQ